MVEPSVSVDRAASPGKFAERVGLALAFAVVLAAYTLHLGQPLLWGDEADTGIFARNVLRSGYPLAWDDRNVMAYANCAEMGEGLVSTKVPWLQYYVGAASLTLFGDDTFGARALFALLGACILFPLRALLCGRVPWPTFVAALILLTPQVALFHRSARYYPVLTLEIAVLLWALFGHRRRPIVAGACLVLAFHTHHLAGLACAVALVVHAFLFDRGRILQCVALAGVAFIPWLVWYRWFPAIAPPDIPGLALLQTEFAAGLERALRGLAALVLDLDGVGALPLLAWAGALAVSGRPVGLARDLVRDPVCGFVLCCAVVSGVASAVTIGFETREEYGLVRYVPHLVVLLHIPLAMALVRAAGARRLDPRWGVCAFCVCVLVTFPTISYWARGSDWRAVRPTWWMAVYGEIAAPPADPLAAVVADLRENAAPDGLLAIQPSYLNAVAVFYLGDRLRVQPTLRADSRCARVVAREASPEAVRRVTARPDVAIVYGGAPNMAGYRARAVPVHRRQPDGTRPELFRHWFHEPDSRYPPYVVYRRLRP